MARLKPEMQWGSGYFNFHPGIADLERMAMLAPAGIEVRIEDKHRQFDNFKELAVFWHDLRPPLEINFTDPRASDWSSLTLFMDDMGTVLVGVRRTPALVTLSDEILRLLKAVPSGQRRHPRQPNRVIDPPANRQVAASSFLQRNKDGLIVGVILSFVSLAGLIWVSYLGLPH
jgi:hypothetical protein